MDRLKSMFFYQLALLSNKFVFVSHLTHLSGIYLKRWFSWLEGGKQTTERKTKNTVKVKQQH